MFSTAKKKAAKLTREQLEAEKRAVEMLKQALDLLQEDDRNAEEARRIRHHVVHEFLPSKKLYILRQDPRSLLLDLDRKIQRAKTRLALNKLRPHKPEPESIKQRVDERTLIRKRRYNQANKQAQAQMIRNALSLIGAFALIIGAFLAAYHYYGPDLFYQSFDIFPNR